MIRSNLNLKKSLSAAALVATGLMFASTAARATVVDLTGSNNSGSIGDAQFVFTQPQPTGTGVIQPFLRVQNDPAEQGYNTSGGTPFDDKAGPWTHDLSFGDLQTSTVVLNGTSYFQLLLDVNEPGGNKSVITLDQLQFYTSSHGSLTTTDISSLGTLRYSFGAGDAVTLDAARNHGSGSGDMYAYIPTSAFAGTDSSDFVYMYVHFGDADPSQGGFEEWTLVANASPIPEMGTFFPVIGLIVAVFSTRALRRRQLVQIASRRNQ
jgi:hypothetical protein